ncbi:hypothetical protein NT6N_26410 [Oceaniferula spumae]|uniref:BCCT family transporter n=1 Tax=Oceaniferula spumae TaxID=2979115 RepID=A0AAT9FNK4_9BACT
MKNYFFGAGGVICLAGYMPDEDDEKLLPDVGADYVKCGRFEFHPVVFPVSAILVLLFTVAGAWWAVSEPGVAAEGAGRLKNWMCDSFGWFFVLTVNVLLVVTLVLGFSKLGRVRLGGMGAKPKFSTFSWLAMLFSAGMGIGLVFWSVAEPMMHFQSPVGGEAAGSKEAAKAAMRMTFFHWGLHAWGVFAVIGAAIAYFSYNKGLPLTIRSTFYPLLGERVRGPWGNAIDVLAVLGTLFGVATSLGLGVQQVNAGLSYLAPSVVAGAGETGEGTSLGLSGTWVQILLIGVITAIATVSVVSGLTKGIKYLSVANLVVAGLLLTGVFLLGDSIRLLDAFVQNVGGYLANLVRMSFWTEAYAAAEQGKAGWQNGWTIFYWAWWISWSPFVGMFIARISYGRTMREFALGVLFVPVLITFVWMTVFGDTALFLDMFGHGEIGAAVKKDVSTALFALLGHFPLSVLTSVVAMLVIVIFFVTSSDSGSLVIDTITAGGHPKPPVVQKVFWALLEGGVAAVLLLSGGLNALQTAAIVTGLPFAAVLLLMAWSLIRALRQERVE